MKISIKGVLLGLLIAPVLSLTLMLSAPAGVSAADYTCKDKKVVSDASKCTPSECSATGGLPGGANCTGQTGTLFGEGGIFTIITNTLLFIIGAVSVIMIIYGGIRYTISGGDAAAVTAAKNTILYAVIGVIVSIMAYAIVNFVLTQFIK